MKICDNRGAGRVGKKEYGLSFEGGDPVEAVMQEARSAKAAAFAKTVKPRAIVFKAITNDFYKIGELIA